MSIVVFADLFNRGHVPPREEMQDSLSITWWLAGEKTDWLLNSTFNWLDEEAI